MRLIGLIKRHYGGRPIHARSRLGLLREIKSRSDTEKRRLRFFVTCLFLNKVVPQDNGVMYALQTQRDRLASLERSRNRALFMRLGLVRKGDGKHIHHRNGNPFDNRMSNLEVVNGKQHKAEHRKEHSCAECKCQAFLKFARLRRSRNKSRRRRGRRNKRYTKSERRRSRIREKRATLHQ